MSDGKTKQTSMETITLFVISSALKQKHAENGMVCALTGLKFDQLDNVLSNESPMTFSNFVMFARAFNLNPSRLLQLVESYAHYAIVVHDWTIVPVRSQIEKDDLLNYMKENKELPPDCHASVLTGAQFSSGEMNMPAIVVKAFSD